MPVQSQFRPDLALPPAAPCAFVRSYRRSATATGLDPKSPGVREASTIRPANRCLVLWSSHTRPVNCRLIRGPQVLFQQEFTITTIFSEIDSECIYARSVLCIISIQCGLKSQQSRRRRRTGPHRCNGFSACLLQAAFPPACRRSCLNM